MAGFFAKEGHRLCGLDCDPHHCTGRAVDAAWQIHRDDWRRMGVHRLDQAPRLAFDRPIEAGAEQRIDQEPRALEAPHLGWRDRPLPFGRRLSGIAFQPARIPEQQHLDPVPSIGQVASRHEAIPAVIARTGHYGDPAADRVTGDDGRRDRCPGAFHQIHAGYPTRNRQAVGFGHFGGGQNLKHGRHNDNETGMMRLASTVRRQQGELLTR